MALIFRVDRVEPASCLDHADIVLAPSEPGDEVRVRVDAASARSVAAELAGVPGDSAAALNLLEAVIRGFEARMSVVELSPPEQRGGAGRGVLVFESESGPQGVRNVPVGLLLVLAARKHLGVVLKSPAPANPSPSRLPRAVEEFLRELPLNSLPRERE